MLFMGRHDASCLLCVRHIAERGKTIISNKNNICYCISPIRRCKARGLEKKNEHFSKEHWAEIKTNLEAYLRDDVCVPYAEQGIAEDVALENSLFTYVSVIAEMRRTDPTKIETFAPIFTSMQRSNAFIVGYGLQVLDTKQGTAPNLNGQWLPRFETVVAENEYVEMAKTLAAAARRAGHELRESVRLDNPLYTLHHQALLYDVAQEMTRLAIESTAVVTEKLLEAQHPHRQLLEEKWQRDGI